MQAAAQLELFQGNTGQRSLADLVYWLNQDARLPIDVILTRNRVSLASIRFSDNGQVYCRLHEQFLQAPQPVLKALKVYCRTRRRAAWRHVDEFAQSIRPEPRTLSPDRILTRGQHHDLAPLYEEINRNFYEGKATCAITWGRRGHRKPGRRYKSVEFGSYIKGDNLVRINPLLDDPRVPETFIRYVIYHEILHAFIPPVRKNGRWHYHPPAFREKERTYPGYQAMTRLCRRLLDELI